MLSISDIPRCGCRFDVGTRACDVDARLERAAWSDWDGNGRHNGNDRCTHGVGQWFTRMYHMSYIVQDHVVRAIEERGP